MALIPFPRGLRPAIASAALLALAACGDVADNASIQSLRAVTGQFFSFGGDDAAPEAQFFTAESLPAEAAALVPGPLIVVEAPDLGATALMVRVGQNAGTQTWRGTIDQQIALTDEFILRSTRGFGFDLMASDVSPTASALRAGRGGPVQQLRVYVVGDLDEERRVYNCELRRGAAETVRIAGQNQRLTQVTESCQGDGDTFENTYMLDRSGRAIQSRQWVGNNIGYFRISVVREQ